MIASGAARADLDAEERTTAAELGYTLPFDSAQTDAAAVAAAPLRCIPMNGASSVSSRAVRAIDAPTWQRYAQLLGGAAHAPLAATVDGFGGRMTHEEMVRVLGGQQQHQVLYLPRRRSRVVRVPRTAQEACGDSCQMTNEEYDVVGFAAFEGFCEETTTGDVGDCVGGRKGSWRLGGNSDFSSVRACLERCRSSCARCSYVSVSLQEHDCSWYAHDACNTAKLRQSGLGHRTYAVTRNMSSSSSPDDNLRAMAAASAVGSGRDQWRSAGSRSGLHLHGPRQARLRGRGRRHGRAH